MRGILLKDVQSVEHGDPTQDTRLFRRCLGQFGTGVAIITTYHRGERAGVTVNSLASVSLDPPLILWSISKTSRSFSIFESTPHFVINILSRDQIALSRNFSSKASDKFANILLESGMRNQPLLTGAIAHIECSREVAYDAGDHVILIGRATNVRLHDGDPLLFVQGRYVVQADHPEAAVSAEVGSGQHSDSPQENDLFLLIVKAYQLITGKFEAHRELEGMSSSTASILRAIESNPGISVSEIERTTYHGVRDTEDALADLLDKGHIACTADGTWSITARGSSKRAAIRRRWKQFQADELSGVPKDDISAGLRLLNNLVEK